MKIKMQKAIRGASKKTPHVLTIDDAHKIIFDDFRNIKLEENRAERIKVFSV